MNKGSQWRKWDLHFHTPSSYDYADMSITNTQIIDELASHNISVVAITDHHVIDVNRITELQKLGEAKEITVLPGIEFLADARGSEPIHFIAIFDKAANINYIWGQIQNNTDIRKIQGEGKHFNEVYCHLFDTIKLIKELGGIVTIHAGKKTNGIENITHSLPHGTAQKEDIARVVDIFEIGKEEDCQGYFEHVIPYLKSKISKHVPMIICTDNHKVTDYVVKQNLWIKADPTFEGLQQICFEPEHRVKIQSDKPDFKEEKLLIDKVRFISPKNVFSTNPIYLNPNLNVIIGGKSSGKSILLYAIAKTLLTESELLNNDDGSPRYDLTKMDDGFDFEITTKGGFSQKLNRPSTDNSILPEIKYIPQNYLVKLAEPDLSRKGKSLNKLVRDLIVEEEEAKEIYSSFTTKLAQNDKLRNTQIDFYFETIREIQLLEEELKTKSNKEVLEKNIETNIGKVEDLNKSTGLTLKQVEEYKSLQTKLEENKSSLQKFRNDLSTIQGFDAELLQSLKNLAEKKQSVLNSLQLPLIRDYYTKIYSKIDELYTDALSSTAESQTEKKDDGLFYLKETSFFNKTLLEINSENKVLTASMDPYLKDEQIKKAIEVLNTSISADKKAVLDIVTLTNKIQEKKKQLVNAKVELFRLYEANYNDYVNVITALRSRTVELEKDGLTILGKAQFNFPKLRNDLFAISDGRTASYSQFEILSQSKKATDESIFSKIVLEIEKLFDDIVTGKYVLTSRSSVINAVKIILTDYFFDFWEITYKNDRLGEMSTGKASFVILMLIIGLSKSKAPILIDQPEDNLDNRSITSDLVNYLRNKKLERQIIIVTHNANIVVNADSENIIIANQKGQNDQESTSQFKFDYINGAIENSFEKLAGESDLLKSMGIRQHIADIVEGGKDAFIMRERKYRFH